MQLAPPAENVFCDLSYGTATLLSDVAQINVWHWKFLVLQERDWKKWGFYSIIKNEVSTFEIYVGSQIHTCECHISFLKVSSLNEWNANNIVLASNYKWLESHAEDN